MRKKGPKRGRIKTELALRRKAAGLSRAQIAGLASCSPFAVIEFEKARPVKRRSPLRAVLEKIYAELEPKAEVKDDAGTEQSDWKRDRDASAGIISEEWLARQVRTFLRERGLLLACDHCITVTVRVADVIELGRMLLRVAGVKTGGVSNAG